MRLPVRTKNHAKEKRHRLPDQRVQTIIQTATKTPTHRQSTTHLTPTQLHHRANILNLALAMLQVRPQPTTTRNRRNQLRRILLHLGRRIPPSRPPRTQPQECQMSVNRIVYTIEELNALPPETV